MIDPVAIIGLGLIGGSLARDLADQDVRVLGYDVDADALNAALAENILDDALPADLTGIEAAAVVVLALPVHVAPSVLAAIGARLEHARLITDVGSTKAGIGAAADRLGFGDRFVGGHPLAGDRSSGWSASRRELFRGARVFLCPGSATRPEALEQARALWSLVGALPELCAADAHDAHVAWISHLPQLASSALALAFAEQNITPSQLGPGGKGSTRLAGSSAEMWTAIALENRESIVIALRALEHQLAQVRRALDAADPSAVRQFLADAARWAAGQVQAQSTRGVARAIAD